MALVAGKLVDIFGTNAIFVSYGVLVGLNVLVVQLFVQDIPAGPETAQGARRISTREWLADLWKIEPIWMLVNLLMYGLSTSLVENYLNVFLVQDFDNVPKVILGAATAVMCTFEIPVFKYIGDLWNKRGFSLVTVLWASEFVMVFRCLLYAILPRSHPWLVLLVEPLHGLTFAGVWTAVVEYARRLSRPGTEAKMQALISGIYFNVAFAAGSLIWGFVSQLPPAGIGFRRSFLLATWVQVSGATLGGCYKGFG
ncbi:cscB [Symbiodinium pilosum]|uniref:CscB protein n=1 Tax=Symbiodinium pilosum TaxID=2952 RepID=A0A812L847_SYMPI|nr:cscB [Symbiodinium pilosum]